MRALRVLLQLRMIEQRERLIDALLACESHRCSEHVEWFHGAADDTCSAHHGGIAEVRAHDCTLRSSCRVRSPVMLTRCARPALRGISAYTILGAAGYVAATVLAVYLGDRWQLTTTERLIGCIAPPAAFVLTVAASAALRGDETIVFYETAGAAVGSVAMLGAIDGAHVERLLDLTTLGIGVFLVFGRLGCLAVGCCHGRPGRGITYGPAHVALGFWARWSGRPLWPIQLVEATASAALVIAAFARSAVPGVATLIYAIGYASVRFPLELARGDATRPYAWGVSEAQWFALATVALCAAWRPSQGTVGAFAALAAATVVLIATRRRRELWSAAHLHELDLVMAAAREGATAETSLGVAVSRHGLDDGRIDWVLSSRHPAWSAHAARRIAAALWPSFELIEGRTLGVVHVIPRASTCGSERAPG